MRRALRHLPFGLTVLVACLALADAPIRAEGSRAPQRRAERLDAKLRAVLGDVAPEPQRVIVRVRPGSRPVLHNSLIAHGDQIVGEHESIDAITAVIHGEDLVTLADSDAVLSISCDAIVRPHGPNDGLIGLAGGPLKTVANVVGSALPPNGANTPASVMSPAVLRQTLGVDNTNWAGRGVGVAIIDSGLEVSAEFQKRVRAFYDFTNGGAIARLPSDDYGHGTHVAGTIGGSGALSYNYSYHG